MFMNVHESIDKLKVQLTINFVKRISKDVGPHLENNMNPDKGIMYVRTAASNMHVSQHACVTWGQANIYCSTASCLCLASLARCPEHSSPYSRLQMLPCLIECTDLFSLKLCIMWNKDEQSNFQAIIEERQTSNSKMNVNAAIPNWIWNESVLFFCVLSEVHVP